MAQRNTYFQDETVKTKINFKQFRRTLRYILPYKKIFYLVCVMMLVSSVVSMVPPLLLRRIINVTVYNQNLRELLLVISGMALLTGLQIAFTYFQQTLMGKLGHTIISNVRREVFYRLQQLPFDYFDSRPDGKIVVRVTEYVNELANFFSNFVLQFLIYIVMLVAATVFMLVISPRLTLVVFLSVVPLLAGVFLLRTRLKPLFSKLRAKNSNRSAFIMESLMGEKIIKNNNRGEVNTGIYANIHDQCVRTWRHIFCLNELNTPIVEICWNVGTLALFGTALFSMLSGSSAIDAGTVVAFTGYMGLFSGPLTQIAILIQQLAQVTSDLEHFDLHVTPGETIALVGPTGAGKTTIINMLTRFYDVQKGSVCIDNIDVRNATLSSLRREVGVLMQDPFIFKGTVMENIRYGRPEATDEECKAAAAKIHADAFIEKLSDGYNHQLEERGAGLSAGEKQIISFVRIILKNPSVIILDEATSSIDTETETLIQKALDVIIKDKTAFIVAHRLSTIRNADRILYIANKTIAEQGTHEELMAKKGLYYKLNVSN